jgi:hypothetical protein
MIPYSEIDLSGRFDLHVHSAPDLKPRKLDDIDLARQAASRGMRGILLKSHWTLTADRAYLTQKVVPDIRIYGGLVLNHSVGGFNPAAVETALGNGAVEIWMPTISAATESENGTGKSLTVLQDGKVNNNVLEILRLIAEHDTILGTGHLSTEEIMFLVPAARQLGVKKILITHPEHPPVEMPPAEQEELRDRYSVLFERCLITTTLGHGQLPFEKLAEVIRRVGPETTIIATDFGQPENLLPVDGLACFISHLHANGFREAEIIRMSQVNPAQLLGL